MVVLVSTFLHSHKIILITNGIYVKKYKITIWINNLTLYFQLFDLFVMKILSLHNKFELNQSNRHLFVNTACWLSSSTWAQYPPEKTLKFMLENDLENRHFVHKYDSLLQPVEFIILTLHTVRHYFFLYTGIRHFHQFSTH